MANTWLTKSISIRGEDGNHIRVSETAERKEVVVSLHCQGASLSIRLSKEQYGDLCDTRYSLDVQAEKPEPTAPDTVHISIAPTAEPVEEPCLTTTTRE